VSIIKQSFTSLPFSQLFNDYLNEKQEIISFFETKPSDLFSTFPDRKSYISREELVKIVRDFNADLELSDYSKQNIELLLNEDTFTVTTGQQIGLFGGYLYTLYKIVTTIKLAKELSEKHQKNVIPIFWIADEDHDFDEANHVSVIKNDSSVETISIKRPSDLHQQVGRELVNEDIEKQITHFFESSGNSQFSEELKSWLIEDFNPKNTQKNAFLRFLNRLFGKHGLVFFGSDTKLIKQATLPVFETAINKAVTVYHSLEDQSKAIESVYHRQAMTDYSLLFLNCKRGRIKLHLDVENLIWSVDERLLSSEDLLSKIQDEPNLLSPNVFLRPIVQEFVLPNIAYIAGPGELAYYAQMKKMYEIFDVPMPVIVPRLSATVIERPFQRYWSELPIQFDGYFKRIEDLEREFVAQNQPFDIENHFQSWIEASRQTAKRFKDEIVHLDQTLDQSVERALHSYQNELEKLKGKVSKSVKNKDEITLQRIRKVQASLYPLNGLQERTIGFVHFLNRYGLDCFEKLFDDSVSALETNHILLFI